MCQAGARLLLDRSQSTKSMHSVTTRPFAVSERLIVNSKRQMAEEMAQNRALSRSRKKEVGRQRQ